MSIYSAQTLLAFLGVMVAYCAAAPGAPRWLRITFVAVGLFMIAPGFWTVFAAAWGIS